MSHKILAIDDDEAVATLIKSRLETQNYQVFTANNGSDGIKLAVREMPDLIILDLMMPQMNGGEVLRRLKNDSQTKNIPIIFLTSMVDMEDDLMQNMGIKIENEYYFAIPKPFNAERFLACIKTCMSRWPTSKEVEY